ncbi:type II secretion system F family protein [Pseudomaricurvus alkylphenolicus]|uniref:type II secretion system F family protein n=1 Tax=Pseudomaricurvus alkylphenolicus TaxID=1306991 RepID=UPI0014205260|nr:type II secretion system F family protein [Pseudomaricurvus alkylphenolicus]NIB44390.1 type II secretion system F family protein [Pseudomaricurvus alkylphenolicus]
MALFDYRGRNSEGELVQGKLDAPSRDAIINRLSDRGVIPLEVVEAGDDYSLLERLQEWRSQGQIRATDLIMFCRQMYTITKAGIPLIRGVRGLAASIRHITFKKVLHDVADQLETGVELSVAMRRHPRIFNNLFISLINVGENSGQLDEAFNQLSQYLERDLETRKSVKSALRYPGFVLMALVAALVVINIWVVPAFADMFKEFGAELPLPTRILIATSDFFVAYGGYLIVIVAGLVFGLKHYIKTEEGSRRWGEMSLKLPIVGDIVERASMARYTRSFALMLRSGVPLVHSLTLCSRVIDNPFLGDKIIAIREGIERGESLSQTHTNSKMFTPLVLQMIAVGEDSGQVDVLLKEVAEFYEREVDYDLASLSARIEPLMIVIMAGMVLVLALGIFLPMWNMYSLHSV